MRLNTSEGWSRDVSADIAGKVLDWAFDATTIWEHSRAGRPAPRSESVAKTLRRSLVLLASVSSLV
jgi:hypothetical protein